MKITTRILVACLPGIVAGALFAASTGDGTISKTNANETALSKAKASMGKLPLSFEPNRGQTDPRVQFLSRGPGYTVFFTKDETVFSLKDTNTSNAVVRMRFVGGTNSVNIHPLEAQSGVSNYMIGNDSSKWLTDVAQYTKLRYENVYPGIDVVYQGDKQHLRYDFVVKPGASANSIAMAFEGAEKLAVTKDGDLAMTLGGKTLVTRRPYTYQETNGTKKEVASHFVVKNNRVTFELASYDNSKDVVIDPSVLFISYLGGLLNDSVNGVAIVNTYQSVSTAPSFYYVTGTTASTNFPLGGGSTVQTALAGANDVFVSKISFNGATLVWSTFLGGNSQESANAIAIDYTSSGCATATSATPASGAGCAVIVGQTYSYNFPVTNGTTAGTAPSGGSNALSGTDDAFVAKLSPDGKTLLFSEYLGGVTNDNATGVVLDQAVPANIYVGGYTDSQFFPGGCTLKTCTNSGANIQSSDAFVVKLTSAGVLTPGVYTMLYGGMGEEFARGIAYSATSKMVYLAGDTTSAPQNFPVSAGTNQIYGSGIPLNVLPGVTNNTALPGPGTGARGGFVVAFDAATLVKTFATYVAVSPTTGICGQYQQTACNVGTESITGIAVENPPAPAVASGIPATGCVSGAGNSNGSCTTPGNVGHIYITGVTTSNVPTSLIAVVVPSWSCATGLNATSAAGGMTIPAGCTTSLVTQAPFNANYANNKTCPYPLVLPLTPPTPTCNLAAFVAILDGALLAFRPVGTVADVPGVGNQIEYWAYYSSVSLGHSAGAPDTVNGMGNSSAVSNAIAIDSNPTTATSVYSLGFYQQMYITGSTTVTTTTGGNNLLPVTSYPNQAVNEIFTPYNVGTTDGGGVGGLTPGGQAYTTNIPNPTSAFIARFNPNGVAACGTVALNPTACPFGGLTNYGGNTTAATQIDRSPLIHTPQFNYGEFLYSVAGVNNKTGTTATGVPDNTTPNTVGNAIAVDITRATIIGGVTNNSQAATASGALPATCPGNPSPNACEFTTSNAYSGGTTEAGGTDGWVAVLFFNDILTNAPSTSTANPFLQTSQSNNTVGYTYMQTGPTTGVTGNSPYLNTANYYNGGFNGTPPPFGPTFDFAISDASTQTQTFQVMFTGQQSGQLIAQTPFYVPLDTRSGANPGTIDNGNPGSGIVYYLPCYGSTISAVTGNSGGGNPYPTPGGPYTPLGMGPATNACTNPQLNGLFEPIPSLYQSLNPNTAAGGLPIFSGWPGVVPSATATTPGWLLVSEDINPGVVRLQLDRRAAAGLLEGTYVAQFLVNTYDPNQGLTGHPTVQWPPCGPQGELNPFGPYNLCPVGTPLPADNESILVTVRLVVRPSLFLSRNAGFLTGITSSLSANPLYGPLATATYPGLVSAGTVTAAGFTCVGVLSSCQDGTSLVPDWLYADGPAGSAVLTVNNPSPAIGQNPNAGPPVCIINSTYGTTVQTGIKAINYNGSNNQYNSTGAQPPVVTNVSLPCPVNGTTAPPPYAGATYAAAAYAGNGPGDSVAATNTTPNITFLYDSGTIQMPNIAPQQGLVSTRPDSVQPGGAFNSDFQGGIDPETQRNDATLHDYYISDRYQTGGVLVPVEGSAMMSVGAVNCTNWNPSQGHNPAVGNWLAVWAGGAATLAPLNQTQSTVAQYVPICTDLTPTTIGTTKAAGSGTAGGVATVCAVGCTFTIPINNDGLVYNGNGGAGQQIELDFLAKAFSNRAQANGIPTGLYTATVYVWSTRAKNVVPGYCLGASMPASIVTTGNPTVDPTPLCGGNNPANPTGIASDNNPNPEVLVPGQQTFNVTLYVFDTTQIVQITPNSCPTTGFNSGTPVTQYVTIANSENLFTGNPLSGFLTPPVAPYGPEYPQFGPNGDGLVVYSLLPFQTTGFGITAPCPTNNSATCTAATGNYPVPLPAGVTVNPQTIAQYNACQVPTGSFGGTTITGVSVPGVGTLQNTGAQSQTVFVPVPNGTNSNATIYACRPTTAPAWLATTLTALPTGSVTYASYGTQQLVYPGNAPQPLFSGAPELYSNGNGPLVTNAAGTGTATVTPVGSAVPSTAFQTCPLSTVPVSTAASKVGIFRDGVPTAPTFLEDSNGNQQFDSGSDTYITTFTAPGGSKAGDIGVAGDWTGNGHFKVGIFRPSTGQWWLDANNDGVFDAGDFTYNFGGLVTGGVNQDVPVVGDWAGTGKSCIGIFRSGAFWLLDLNCDGTFTSGTDAFFPFGGLANDQPVVEGNHVGVVRAYAPGGVVGACTSATNVGCPFYWVFDSAAANNASGSAATHQPAAGSFAYGGLFGDVFVTGDWQGNSQYQAGVYRGGFWLLDVNGSHTYQTFFGFGGLAGDSPIVGKW